MKKAALILAILVNMLFLSGCWDRREINDVAVIVGVGIDQKEDKTIEVTVEMPIPKAIGGQQGKSGGGGNGQILTRSGYGASIADALANLQEKLPRQVFWGHLKVVVIGEKLAKEGIASKLDFFIRHHQPRFRSYVFISTSDPKKILALLPPLEVSSSEVLREIAKSDILMSVTLRDLLLMLNSEAGTAALPMLDILPPEKGKEPLQTIAYIKRSAIFRKDKMIGSVNDKATRGILWLRDEVQQGVITINPEEMNGNITVSVIRSQTELIPQIENEKWKMTVHTEVEGDLILNETRLPLINPKLIETLEKEFKKDIEHRIKVALHEIQKVKKTDILGFAEAFYHRYPREWKKAKDDWDKIFPTLEVSFDIKVSINRPGMSTAPLTVPKNEVKQK